MLPGRFGSGGRRESWPKVIAHVSIYATFIEQPTTIVASLLPLSEYYAAWVSPLLARTTRGCILP